MNKWIAAAGLAAALTIGGSLTGYAAQQWYWVGHDVAGNQFFVNNSGVKNEGDVKRIWTKINKKDGSFVKNYMAIRRDHKYAILRSAEYDRTGKPLSTEFAKDVEWNEIPEKSMMEKLYHLVW